jgi:hypothetical protein
MRKKNEERSKNSFPRETIKRKRDYLNKKGLILCAGSALSNEIE